MISQVSVDSEKPLQIFIHNGVSVITLLAQTIKEKVDWVNALNEGKEETKKFEKQKTEKNVTEANEKLNDVLATNLFNKFDPLYTKIGKVWSVQAQFEEVMSLMEPELKKNPRLKSNGQKLLELTNEMKESVASVLGDLEGARKEFAKALQRFSEVDEPLDFEDSLSEDDLRSNATIRSIKIQPKQGNQDNFEEIKNCSDDEETKQPGLIKGNSLVKFNPRDLSEDAEYRTQLPAFKDPNRTFSLWGMIRDNIGQDLTRVTLPIILNEPVTMLQKCSESMVNFKVLEDAAKASDS